MPTAQPSPPTNSCCSASTWDIAEISRGSSCWPSPTLSWQPTSYPIRPLDCRNNRLLDGVTSFSDPAQAASPLVPSMKVVSFGSVIDRLLTEFPDLNRPTGVQCEVRHSTLYHIRTIPGPLVSHLPTTSTGTGTARYRHVAGQHCSSLQEFLVLCPTHRSKDNGWRPCGVYRAPNARAIPDRYPVCHIFHYSRQLFGCSVFSKIDLWEHTTKFRPSRRHYCHYRPFCPLRVPFHVLRPMQWRPNLSALQGWHSARTQRLFRLFRQHPSILPFTRGAQANIPEVRWVMWELLTKQFYFIRRSYCDLSVS
jgi:hypothetical protein